MPKAELSAGLASGRFKGPEGSPACSRPARRTLAGLRHSPDSVCARTSRHTGTRTRPATQQPFGYLRDSHDPALVTSVIQTARQWRDRTAGTGWGPPPQGPPGRPRRAKRPARHQPGARAAPPTCTHARTHAQSCATGHYPSQLSGSCPTCPVVFCRPRSILGRVRNMEDVWNRRKTWTRKCSSHTIL